MINLTRNLIIIVQSNNVNKNAVIKNIRTAVYVRRKNAAIVVILIFNPQQLK
jgi:hypothetical protein